MTVPLDFGFCRRFPSELESIASVWSTNSIMSDKWTPTGKTWGTNSQPLMVTNENSLRGVAKPGALINDRWLRAAHEKIIADLAYVLGLPVPPVTLWDRGDGFNGDRHCAISAFAFSNPIEWPIARVDRTSVQLEMATLAAGAMKAFDTWISASDRKDEHVLVDDRQAEDAVGLAYIDYAFALSYEWGIGPGGIMADPRPSFPSGIDPDMEAVATIIQAIESLEEQKIEEIVNRVPSGYFVDNARDVITSSLLQRRGLLRLLMNMPGGAGP